MAHYGELAELPLVQSRAPFRRRIVNWYRKQARDLPWRGTRDPYAIWIAEIVLQQTRVEQGTPYIQRFLKTFPDVHALAAADQDEVLKLWEGLGYYTRARNLHKAARKVVSEYAGALPRSAEEWRTLPGVGPYTAGAIASIAFAEPVPVLDGNVKRVLARLSNLEDSIDDTAVHAALWELMHALVQGKYPGDFNQGMMELGSQCCTSHDPACRACPVQPYCAAHAADTVQKRPVRTKKKPVPHHEVVVAVIGKNGRYLLGKRPPDGLLGGLWEFPGGKVAPDESHATALKREIREELGIGIRVGGIVATVNHAYSHFKITLNVYRCVHVKGTPKARVHTEIKWVRRADFGKYAFPKANHKFLDLL